MGAKDPIQMYMQLKRLADGGNSRARMEMQKLEASPQFRDLVAMFQSTALAVAQPPAEGEETIGAVDEHHHPRFHYADELEQAAEAVEGIDPSDDLTRRAALRGHNWSSLQKVAPFARTNPPSVLQGTLGGSAALQVGQTQQVANWAGSDAETTPVTVTLAPVQQVAPGLTPTFRPYARIQFGTRAFAVSADIDIGRGCQFTISASQVVLSVGVEAQAPPGVPPAGFDQNATINLTGMLSFNPIVRTAPLTRTIMVPNGATGLNLYLVPAFAKSVRFVKYSPLFPDTLLIGGPSNAALGVAWNYDIPATTQMTSSFLLPDETVFIEVKNVATGFDAFGALIFELAL